MLPLDPLTLPLRGQMLLEASAGTGKTYTLALLFLRLLLERELSIDQILVVTFTVAATEELRGRVRLRIREALDVLQGKPSGDATLDALITRTRKKDPARTAILLDDALTRMDEAAIFTIHGFCRHMLQEHAFESSAPFAMEFLENEQALQAEVMEDFWRRRFYDTSPGEAAWAASLWTTPQGLYDVLGGHLNRPTVQCVPKIHDDDVEQMRKRLHPLFEDIRGGWQQQGDKIAALLRENRRLSRNNTTGYGHKRLAAAVAAMDEFTMAESMPWLLPEEISLFTKSAIDNSLLKNKHEPPRHRFFELVDEFFPQHREMTHCRKISVLLAARHYLHAEMNRRKLEQARLYFDDLLLRMDAALHGPRSNDFAAGINKRFPAILVDEFQDTDPLQYRIFSRIHGADRSSALFLIGDPKQAIYGFRGADIFTYLMARQATPPGHRFTMTTNYRSTSRMVTAVNQLFGRYSPLPPAGDAMKFIPVQPSGLADTEPMIVGDRPIAPLTCLLLPEQNSGKPLAKDKAAEQAARFCALEISALLGGKATITTTKTGNRPVSGGDIGILVRTHREAEIIRNALRGQRIASVYYSKSTVFQTSEAGQMLTLLTALLNPADPATARTLLATDLFGYTAERLEELRREEQRWEEIMATLNRYQHSWQQQGFLPMFHTLLSEQRCVQRLLAAVEGERMLTNFLHLAELLQEASRSQPGVEGLYHWLADNIRQPDRQQTDSSQLRLESDENLVKIVTIHKAKGLEYPLVFLPFLWSTRPCDPEKPFSFHHPDRPEQLCIDLGSGNAEYLRLAEQERLAADLRLLYVAVTRARYGCFFCWGRISKMHETALCTLLHGDRIPEQETLVTDLAQLNSRQAPLVIKHYPENPAPPVTPACTPDNKLAAARFTGAIDTSWQITSYSGLSGGHDPRPERPDYDQQDEPQIQHPENSVFGFPKGPAAGTCLHAILEQIDFTDPAGHGPIIAEQLAGAGFESSWQRLVGTWMQAILATRIKPDFSLNQLAARNRINEMAFSFPLEKMRLTRFNQALASGGIAPLPENHHTLHGLMVGFIDLVFRHNGRYYIIDYKSNYLGGSMNHYRPENLRAAMDEHRYDLQYLIYTLALHRYLHSRIKDYDYDTHFGGIYYLFLRGMNPQHPEGTGIFAARPPLPLITRLDICCRGNGND